MFSSFPNKIKVVVLHRSTKPLVVLLPTTLNPPTGRVPGFPTLPLPSLPTTILLLPPLDQSRTLPDRRLHRPSYHPKPKHQESEQSTLSSPPNEAS